MGTGAELRRAFGHKGGDTEGKFRGRSRKRSTGVGTRGLRMRTIGNPLLRNLLSDNRDPPNDVEVTREFLNDKVPRMVK